MNVSDITIQSEGLGDFKNSGQGLNISKKMAENVLRNPGQAMDNTANFATAAASRSLQKVISTVLELISFYNKGKGLYLGEFV